MNELISKLTGFLGPAGSSALGQALTGLAILVIGLLLVKFFISIIKKILAKIPSLQREQADGSVTDLASPIASLLKAVLTILVLIAVLEHFGLTNVLDPLKEMVRKFAAVLPNIIGAGVIAYAGWVIAKVVSQLAGVALGKARRTVGRKDGQQGNQHFRLR